jgi:hypothetical protein
MLKKLLTITMLACSTAALVSAQNIPLFFHGNDCMQYKTDSRNKAVERDGGGYLLKTHSRFREGLKDEPTDKYTNSYFFFKKHALSTGQTDSLNKYLYNQQAFDLLQKVSILNFTAQRSTVINAEVFSALFGPVRVGIGGSFQPSKSDTLEDAKKASLEKIRNQGGTLSINGLFPMMYLRSKNDAYHMGLFAQQQFGLTPNKIDSSGTTSYSGENTNLAIQSGLFLHMDAGSKNENNVSIHLYADVSYFYTYGNYYQVLKMADFGILGLRVGCVVGDLIHFNASGPLHSTAVSQRNVPYTIGIQFSPSQVATAVSGKDDKPAKPAENKSNNDEEE